MSEPVKLNEEMVWKIIQALQPDTQAGSLEEDLTRNDEIIRKIRGPTDYAQHLYHTLCNNEFVKDNTEHPWSCTWRYAGGLVAELKQADEDYLDYYCSGFEGHVDEEVAEDLNKIGWKVVEETNNNNDVQA